MKKKIVAILTRHLFLGILMSSLLSAYGGEPAAREFYHLTVYHFSTDAQEKQIDGYLKNALIPALHRMNLKNIGSFKPLGNDTANDKRIYVLVNLKSLDMVNHIFSKLKSDKDYQARGAEYLNAVYNAPPYTRMETILLQAFSMAPKMQLPALKEPKSGRVYELRSYEGATEKIYENKVHMFNQGGEINIFKNLNFNAIFYGDVLAGSKMPNLMYMTSFENMEDRNNHWKAFSADPDWKKLSSEPGYKNNVSHIDILLMRPTDYSDY